MALITPWPSFRQGLVRHLRSNLVLKDELSGGVNEALAPQNTPYPRLVYQLHFAPGEYDWTGVLWIIGFDVVVFSKESAGEAASLDQLVFATLQDAVLSLAGQTSLTCRRVSNISLTDEDDAGTTIYSMGGVYQAVVEQKNPVLGSLTFTIGATIGA